MLCLQFDEPNSCSKSARCVLLYGVGLLLFSRGDLFKSLGLVIAIAVVLMMMLASTAIAAASVFSRPSCGATLLLLLREYHQVAATDVDDLCVSRMLRD